MILWIEWRCSCALSGVAVDCVALLQWLFRLPHASQNGNLTAGLPHDKAKSIHNMNKINALASALWMGPKLQVGILISLTHAPRHSPPPVQSSVNILLLLLLLLFLPPSPPTLLRTHTPSKQKKSQKKGEKTTRYQQQMFMHDLTSGVFWHHNVSGYKRF